MKKKVIVIMLGLILVACVGTSVIKNYSPIDVLRIQETTIELEVGEVIQLNLKGYKYKSDRETLEEVDISNMKISWNSSSDDNAITVSEGGKVEALKEGIGNVWASYKDKVGARPVTVFVYDYKNDNGNVPAEPGEGEEGLPTPEL